MIVNHINIAVSDVAVSRDFYTKYFGLTVMMERGENFLAILRDDAGMVFNISHFDKAAEVSYPRDFHIGFFLENREQVEAVRAQMLADGLEVAEPRRAQGRWTFYFQVPGGVLTEVGCLEGAGWQPGADEAPQPQG